MLATTTNGTLDTLITWGGEFLDSYNFNYIGFPSYKEVKDKENDLYIIKVAVPGLKKEDLTVLIDKKELSIEYKGHTDFIDSFKLVFGIEDYNHKKTLNCNLANGILEIKLEKRGALKPKRIKL